MWIKQIQHPNEEAIAQAKLLPVIVFVHGGGFNAYWGSVFGGQRLLNDPVVLVTLNYRCVELLQVITHQ